MSTTENELVLDSFFELMEDQLFPQVTIHQGIGFHFDHQSLLKVLSGKEDNLSLKISDSLLRKIRYYCLIDQYQGYTLQSHLNFVSYFDPLDATKGLVKTSISIEGQVNNQICDRCLKDQNLALSLTTAHYWLIDQILAQLHLQFNPAPVKKWLRILAWAIALSITIITVLFNLQAFQNNPLLWIAPVVTVYLLQWGLQKLLWLTLPRLRPWLLRQTLYGLFASTAKTQHKALHILSYLGLNQHLKAEVRRQKAE